MKFCGNCGKQLEDSEMFCSSCGAAQDGANQTQQQAPKTAGETAQEYGKKAMDFAQEQINNVKKMDIKKIAIAAVALVLVVILLVNVFRTFIHGTGTITVKGAVKEYLTYDKMEDYLDVTMTHKMQKAFKDDLESVVDDYDEYIDARNDDLADSEAEYKNIKIEKKKKQSKSKIKKWEEAIDDDYDVKVNITKLYKVDISFKYRSDSDSDWSDKQETTLYIGKISGNYYVLSGATGISSSDYDFSDLMDDLSNIDFSNFY